MPERKESRDWTLFLSDMQLFCSRVIRYCHGLSAEQFAADDLVTDAVLRNLKLLGEAAKMKRSGRSSVKASPLFLSN